MADLDVSHQLHHHSDAPSNNSNNMAAHQHSTLFTFGTADSTAAARPFDFRALVPSAMASNPFGFDAAFQLDDNLGFQSASQNTGLPAVKMEPQVMASKTFDPGESAELSFSPTFALTFLSLTSTDFMNLPFDLSAAGSGLPSSFDTFAFPFAMSSDTSNLPPLPVLSTNPLALDRGLDSPLGLEQDSPYSEFLASPMFEDAGDLPPPLDYDYPSLFPTSSNTNAPPTPALVPLPSHGTSLRPNPAPPARPPLHHSPFPSSVASTPALTPSLPLPSGPSVASTPAAARPRATGFRGSDTPLVPIHAPVQARQYVLPSATSRKRKTTAVERELAKRGRSTPAPAGAADQDAPAEEIPSDLVAAVERKRLQNTLAARKSRQRKQERLGELEERNRVLEEENVGLKSRVEELEAMLRSMGISV